jgi:hypothetical protein
VSKKILGVNNVRNEFENFWENSEKFRKKNLWSLKFSVRVKFLVAGASRHPPDFLGPCPA